MLVYERDRNPYMLTFYNERTHTHIYGVWPSAGVDWRERAWFGVLWRSWEIGVERLAWHRYAGWLVKLGPVRAGWRRLAPAEGGPMTQKTQARVAWWLLLLPCLAAAVVQIVLGAVGVVLYHAGEWLLDAAWNIDRAVTRGRHRVARRIWFPAERT